MSTSPSVYVNGTFSEPMTAQHNFQNKYDLDNPVEAMETYARYVFIYPRDATDLLLIDPYILTFTPSIMHQHTKSQMDLATRSARRRSPINGVSSMSSLSAESSAGSQTST